jgi:transcriptional regulator with XRE-family HTH domain
VLVTFGERLQELRLRAGLSQSELAAKAALPLRTIQNWEIGRREPRAGALFQVASALGISVEEFRVVSWDSNEGRPRKKD